MPDHPVRNAVFRFAGTLALFAALVFAACRSSTGPIPFRIVQTVDGWAFVDTLGRTLRSDVRRIQTDATEPRRIFYGTRDSSGAMRWGLLKEWRVDSLYEITSPPFADSLYDFHFVEGWLGARDGGLWGYVDTIGRWSIAPAYDEVLPFQQGRAWVRKGDSAGVLARDSGYAVPLRGDIVWERNAMLQWFEKNGRYGIVDVRGEVLTAVMTERRPAELFRNWIWLNDPESVVVRGDMRPRDRWSLHDQSGNLLAGSFHRIRVFPTHTWVANRHNDEWLWGFVDSTGRLLVDPRIHPIPYGAGELPVQEGGRWGFMVRGKFSLQPEYEMRRPKKKELPR